MQVSVSIVYIRKDIQIFFGKSATKSVMTVFVRSCLSGDVCLLTIHSTSVCSGKLSKLSG